MAEVSIEITPHAIVTGPYWWEVNIGSGIGFVPSGINPLPEPMLTMFYDAIASVATMS